MAPATRVVLVLLCAYCTVKAQKPGGTNTQQAASRLANAGSGLSSLPAGAVAGTAAGAAAGTASGAQAATCGPSRVVFQSTPASDARTEAAFGCESGWGSPVSVPVARELAALSFDGGGTNVPSPICFPCAGTVTVQTVMLAARGASADFATLVDAPETARLRIAAEGAQEPEMTGAERALTEQFLPDRWLAVGIDLESPTNLAALFFGGAAGRPEWARSWQGEIAEIVGFSAPPSADVRAGVANYLSVRWGFGGHAATAEQRQAAIDAGLDYGRAWGSVIFIR